MEVLCDIWYSSTKNECFLNHISCKSSEGALQYEILNLIFLVLYIKVFYMLFRFPHSKTWYDVGTFSLPLIVYIYLWQLLLLLPVRLRYVSAVKILLFQWNDAFPALAIVKALKTWKKE